MEKYNILFLDFDGVINNSDLNQENDHLLIPDDFNQYNPILVKNIKTIIHEYNFKLVISSTWRKDYSIQKMNYILNDLLNLDCEILDYTTKEYLDKEYKYRLEWTHGAKSIDRGLQITKWLSEEKYDINFYVVIDDDLDAEFGHTENFFAVNSMTGFDENTLKRFRIYMRTFLC